MKLSRIYSAILKTTLVAGAVSLAACGGGGAEGTTVAKKSYVTVEDGNIIGALVTDSAIPANTATDLKNGQYRFEVIPTLPITITPTANSFQDLDGDGKLSPADIPYKAALIINDAELDFDIKANPVAALLPAGWYSNPTPIAGLDVATIKTATAKGVDKNNDQVSNVTIKSYAAMLTALQEFLIKAGVTGSSTNAIISFIGTADQTAFAGIENSATPFNDFLSVLKTLIQNSTDTNLFDKLTFEAGQIPTGGSGNFKAALINYIDLYLKPSIAANDTILQDAKTAKTNNTTLTAAQTASVDNAEAVIKVIQDNQTLFPTTSTATPIDQAAAKTAAEDWTTLNDAVDAEKLALADAINSDKKILIEQSLYLVPGITSSGTADRDLVSGTYALTNFSMIYDDATNSIAVASSDFSDFDGKAAIYDAEAQGYIYSDKVGDASATKAFGIKLSVAQTIPDANGNIPDESTAVVGRLLTYSVDSGTTQHIAMLATKEQICGSDFSTLLNSTAWDSLNTKTLLEVINQINLTDEIDDNNIKPPVVCSAP